MNTPLRTIFMGSGEIGLPTLQWMIESPKIHLVGVVTQPDKPVGRSQILTAPAPKRLAESIGVTVLQPIRVRRPEALNQIAELRPNLIVVAAYGQILPRPLLEMPTVACLNLHASLLPRHRGAAPIQSSILAGDAASGITVMYVAEGLDSGDILLQKSLPIRHRETGGSLHDRLARLAPEALGSALEMLIQGEAPRVPQAEDQATYAGKLDRDSGLVHWTESCWQIDRLVRAMNPWPGAYTLVSLAADEPPRRLKLHRVLPMHRWTRAPGQILGLAKRGLIVGTGTGSVLLLEVQLEGKRRMSASEFVRGFPLPVGSTLGVSA
ncbi:MAG TPA: methionyl-tRNA formyltransferase [Chthoniobacterales bacterium]|nr:methionyl-tRNA formyltransferase [Chthoniobacterales bacterium]